MTRAEGVDAGVVVDASSSMRCSRRTSSRSAASAAVAPDEPEQSIDASHARPGQRTVEERGGVAADGLAMTGGLALEGGDIAHRVDAALDGIVGGINRSATRRLPGMRFDPDVVMIEADQLLIGAGGHVRAHVPMRHRIECLRDGHQLIAADLTLGSLHS